MNSPSAASRPRQAPTTGPSAAASPSPAAVGRWRCCIRKTVLPGPAARRPPRRQSTPPGSPTSMRCWASPDPSPARRLGGADLSQPTGAVDLAWRRCDVPWRRRVADRPPPSGRRAAEAGASGLGRGRFLSAMPIRFILPLAVFVLVAGVFAYLLASGHDASKIPSVLIDKPAPAFDLGPLDDIRPGLATADLAGHVSVVNFFASWCLPCRAEHPLLMRLAEDGGRDLRYQLQERTPRCDQVARRTGQSLSPDRRRRYRSRGYRVGRLWPAGDLHCRQGRPHSFQACRADYASRPRQK